MEYRVDEGNYTKFGIQKKEDGVIFTFAGTKEEKCFILLYKKPMMMVQRIEAPADYCMGSVRSVYVHGLDAEELLYNYEIDGAVVEDPYGNRVVGRDKWNDSNRKKEEYFLCCGYENDDFDWEQDRQPEIPKSEMIMYKLHVRGFSMDAGLKGSKKGTFAGIMEKIPYLKSLGVTTLELMPAYEFEEIEHHKKEVLPDYLNWVPKEDDMIRPIPVNSEERLNYWGYTTSSYFAPKASYSMNKQPAIELKQLIQKLHQNKMECIMELYFDTETNQNLMLDALRYWVADFHVDGFHLIGEHIPILAIAQDLYLSRTKIFYHELPQEALNTAKYPHLYLYNEEYLYAGRKLLNQQGGSLNEFCNQQKKQNEHQGFVNFLTNNNGFTLADLFSYSEKHNEANGEDNTDGMDYNYSVNCGVEGKSGKRYVKELRRKHIYNAFCMLFFAQGVPLIMAGDEFENSQEGNNNAYCQDNKIGWLNWKNLEKKKDLFEFLQKLIAFRQAHPVLRKEEPMKMNDYLHKGCPDLSYHLENAWVLEFSREKSAFGMMYNGNYASKDGVPDDFIYIGYNFYTGICNLALPKLPDKKKWYLIMDTAREKETFLNEMEAVTNQQQFAIKSQSIMLLIGK